MNKPLKIEGFEIGDNVRYTYRGSEWFDKPLIVTGFRLAAGTPLLEVYRPDNQMTGCILPSFAKPDVFKTAVREALDAD